MIVLLRIYLDLELLMSISSSNIQLTGPVYKKLLCIVFELTLEVWDQCCDEYDIRVCHHGIHICSIMEREITMHKVIKKNIHLHLVEIQF